MKVPNPRAAALAEYLNSIKSDTDRARDLISTPLDDQILVEIAAEENIPVSILRSVSRSLPQ